MGLFAARTRQGGTIRRIQSAIGSPHRRWIQGADITIVEVSVGDVARINSRQSVTDAVSTRLVADDRRLQPALR